MKPQVFALVTAVLWGVGGFFEKKGLHHGDLSPQMGITIRTAVALVILAIISFPHWKTVPQAGTRSLLYMAIGGGVLAGSVAMLFFYSAIKAAPLGRVLPIAFTAPLFGVMMGWVFGGEAPSIRIVAGMAMTIGGIVLLTVG